MPARRRKLRWKPGRRFRDWAQLIMLVLASALAIADGYGKLANKIFDIRRASIEHAEQLHAVRK